MSPSSFNSSDATEFIGNRILVTGGTRGAGKAIAERIQRGGATVIVNARSVPEGESANHFIRTDVSTTEGTTRVINACFPTFHRIHTIRAGVQEPVNLQTKPRFRDRLRDHGNYVRLKMKLAWRYASNADLGVPHELLNGVARFSAFGEMRDRIKAKWTKFD